MRRSLGVILQETNLFTGTVMDNIRYGKLDATEEECIAAANLPVRMILSRVFQKGIIHRLRKTGRAFLRDSGSSLQLHARQSQILRYDYG